LPYNSGFAVNNTTVQDTKPEIHHAKVSNPETLPPTSTGFLFSLGVLPGGGPSSVRCDSIKAQASIIKIQTLESDEHLPGAFVVARSRTGNETAVLVCEVAERLAFSQVPPSDDVALGDGGRVSDSVLDSARFELDVHLLTTRNDSTHTEGIVSTKKVGSVADWAAAHVLYVARAEGTSGLVEPDGLIGGREGLVMDR
jgi:hypothetical protein